MTISYEERTKIEAFLFLEARLADESQYSAWEELIDDKMEYVVYGDTRGEPGLTRKVALINDHRERIASRIRQFKTGRRYAQVPPSPMRRMLSNIEIFPKGERRYEVACNFVVYELQIQTSREMVTWPGRFVYGLRETETGFRMFSKKVELVNRSEPLPNLSILI